MKKIIDDVEMAKYIKSQLNETGKNIDIDLILEILDYQLLYLDSKGLVKGLKN